MIFSVFGFFTVTLFISAFIIFNYFFLNKSKLICQIGTKYISFFILVAITRLLFPFELLVAKEIHLPILLPSFYSWLNEPILTFRYGAINMIFILSSIWVGGILLYLTKNIQIYVAFVKLTWGFARVSNDNIRNVLKHLSKKYGNTENIKIVETNLVSTPMLFGIFSPVIILPKINFSEIELNYILEHEIAHYRHHDIIIKSLLEIICIIYWWNPFIYVFRKDVCNILELNADARVTKSLDEVNKIDYMQCLLKVAKRRQLHTPHHTAIGLVSHVSPIKQRFEMIFTSSSNTRKALPKVSICFVTALLLLLVFSLFSVIQPDYSYEAPVVQDTFTITSDNAYYVKNPEGGHDLYVDGKYMVTIQSIIEHSSDIKIYNNISEVHAK